MAPEVISNLKGYNKKAEIWSLGITCIELKEGEAPYHQLNMVRAMVAITTNPPKGPVHPECHSKEFNAFVERCLIVDSNSRPTASELLSDPFIIKSTSKIPIIGLVTKSSDKINQFRQSLQEAD
jgi:serine/threonine protein kinase